MARSDWVVNQTFDLFLELNANDEQMDFPVVYASGLHGKASMTLELEEDMGPLFEVRVGTRRIRGRRGPGGKAGFQEGWRRAFLKSCPAPTHATPHSQTILAKVRAPLVDVEAPLQLLVTNLDYDEHKGRIAIGRINAGRLSRGDSVAIMTPEDPTRQGKIAELFVFDNFAKKSVDSVEAGEICALSGLADVGIGETVTDPRRGVPLPKIKAR